MADWKDEVEEIVFDGKICVPYSWTVGNTLSKWYGIMRDDAEIWANRCPSCNTVFVPPKKKCIYCYRDVNDWVKLPGTGVLETYTVVHHPEPGVYPKETPFVYGVVKMDGADTGLVHFIEGIEPEKVKSGMRVEAVMSSEREGNLMDIECFRPVD